MTFRRTTRQALNILVAQLVIQALAGCATPGRSERLYAVLTDCVSDPLTRSLHCVTAQGAELDVPWEGSANYVCRPPGDDATLEDEAHRR